MIPYRAVALPCLLLGLAALPTATQAQTVFTGTLGKQPVQLVVYPWSDGAVTAAYVYERHDTPIRVPGRLDAGVLELHEQDAQGKDVAVLRLAPFDTKRNDVHGEWIPTGGGAARPVALHRQYDMDELAATSGPVELLQAASTGEHYFKVRVAPGKDRYASRTVSVAVYRKGTDALVQTLPVDTQFRGMDDVQVGDFNFDGVTDFSVFEQGYAGPNTSSLYFLRDAASGQYVQSRFEGVSLEFDENEKRVHEHNQCCAGRSHQNAIYRVEGDRLVLESKQCLEYEEGKEELVEVPCEVEEDRD